MLINFITNLETSKILKIYDVTPITELLPLNIYEMTLDIKCSRLENGKIPFKLDILSYLKLQRKQNELFTVTSETLGLAKNIDIPDGVYHFEYSINNTIKKENLILVYQNVKSEVEELLKKANYNVNVGDYQLQYLNESITDSYDIEKVRYAKTLLDKLEFDVKTPDEISANNTLDKLEKILGILKQ